MTREEAMCYLYNPEDEDCYNAKEVEAYNMAIKALKQEPCDDAISRQAVEETIFEQGSVEKLEIDFAKLLLLRRAIKALPPVTLQPNTGHWIPVSERLPEEFESVLVCYKSQGGMAQAVSERFGTHTGYRWSALAGIEPIAWMPLPEPYHGGDKNDNIN